MHNKEIIISNTIKNHKHVLTTFRTGTQQETYIATLKYCQTKEDSFKKNSELKWTICCSITCI